jgi:hypothetical protein
MEYEHTTRQLNPEVVESLRQSEITGEGSRFLLKLPAQLDPAIYQKVDAVIKTCGGKWTRGAKAHVFGLDPRPMLEVILETGMEPANNPLDYFPTPTSVSEGMLAMAPRIISWGNVENLPLVDRPILLEPSAGQGNLIRSLLKVAPGWAGHIEAVEANALNAGVLAHLAKSGELPSAEDGSAPFNLHEKNFLDWEPTPGRHPRMALMNPPFSYKGNTTTFIDHILHAWKILQNYPDRGEIDLVSVCPTGWLGRRTKKEAEFFDLVAAHGYIERCAPEAFKESGTSIDTAVIHLNTTLPHKGQDEESENEAAHTLALYLDNNRESHVEARKLGEATTEWVEFLQRWQIHLAKESNPVCLPVTESIATKVRELMVG